MKMAGLSLDQAPPLDIPFRFFLSAPVFGTAAGVLLVIRGDAMLLTTIQLETVALVHLITLGWLAMVMMGAFYQMVPVLVGGQVPAIGLARLIHGLFVLGVLALVMALMTNETAWFRTAAICLPLPLLVFACQIAVALFRVEGDRPVVVAMRISIISLAVTLALGVYLVGFLANWWTFPVHRLAVKSGHVTVGLLGWIGCLVMGVGFHVIPMFYLTASFPARRAAWILRAMMVSLGLVTACFLFELKTSAIILAGVPGILSIALFSFSILRMLHQRKRKIVDVTLRFWRIGLFALPLSFAFLLLSPLSQDERSLFLFGLLFLIGFVMAITNGMLYKIVPFLIWFHRYSALAGQPGVPMLKDILSDRHARQQWLIFVAMFVILVAGVLSRSDPVLRLGGLLLAASSAAMLGNLFVATRTRRIGEPMVA